MWINLHHGALRKFILL